MNDKPRARGRDVVTAVLTVVFVLIVLGLINQSVVRVATGIRWYDGDRDDQITTPLFNVRIDDVYLADHVATSLDISTTDGVFVVVEWSVDVKKQGTSFRDIQLVTRSGATFAARAGHLSAAQMPSTQPGFTSTGTAVFQVHPNDVAGAQFRVVGGQRIVSTYTGGARFNSVITEDTPYHPGVFLPEPTTLVTP